MELVHETQRVVAQHRRARARSSSWISLPSTRTCPRRAVEAAEDLQQRRLSGARGADDGQTLGRRRRRGYARATLPAFTGPCRNSCGRRGFEDSHWIVSHVAEPRPGRFATRATRDKAWRERTGASATAQTCSTSSHSTYAGSSLILYTSDRGIACRACARATPRACRLCDSRMPRPAPSRRAGEADHHALDREYARGCCAARRRGCAVWRCRSASPSRSSRASQRC